MINNKIVTPKYKKRIFLFAVILLDIIGIVIIPLNLYFINMPEYLSIIISAFIILSNIMLWIKGKPKAMVKTILSLICIASILFSLFGTYCNPYWNSLSFRDNINTLIKDDNTVFTQAEALADLDYAMKYLKKLHPALYQQIPEDIESQYERAKLNLKNCENIDVCTLTHEIESIFSLLHDAHTYVNAWYNNEHFLKYIYEHNQAGDKVIRINDMTLEELFHKNSHLISYETEAWGMTYIYNYISSAEGLKYLGISVEDGVKYTYEDKNGEETNFIFTKKDFVTYKEYVKFNNIEDNSDTDASFVRYKIDDENNIAILTLDSCTNNTEYQNCLRKMFSEIKDKKINNVAVDLRSNGGGSSSVANEFLRYLNIDSYKEWASVWRLGIFEVKNSAKKIVNDKHENLLFNGNLYLLTSVYTFSSAMDFAMMVKDNRLGTIIGEASGNNPGSYGDITFFTLPNSGIYMQISTKKWYRIDENLENQLIEPDIPCNEENAIDYLYHEIHK